MKRLTLHILFWFVYIMQDTFLHFTWMAPVIKSFSDSEQFLMAVKAALSLLPPKLLLVYYFTGVGIKNILNEQLNRFKVIAEILFILLLSLLLFRVIFHYVVYPKIYLLPVKINFLNARNTLIAVLEIGYISGVAITLKLLRLQTASKEREKNLVNEKLGAELKFLRNQTNPHFLFNTLNNIYALARKKSDDTAEAVMKLSKLLRFMLYESGKDLITITQEIKILDDYLELEKIRYNERLAITFEREIDNGGKTIAPLLLLPFIENAFKHGVSETRFNSHIHIDLKLKQGRLSFQIENSKENGNADSVKDNIGLSNVRRQLELMYKEYSMDVQNGNDLFKVLLTINLDSHAKI